MWGAMRLARLTAIALAALVPLGCASQEPDGPADSTDDYEIIPDGKVDNYRSSNAQEFSASASATVTLDASFASKNADERMAAARELVSAKLLQIGWFLNL